MTPWIFDSNGGIPTEHIHTETKDLKKRQGAYIAQLEFINKKTSEVIEKLLSESENKPIIIVLSDHGTRQVDEGIPVYEKAVIKWGNFMAYYLPYDVDTSLYTTISPVNTFRLIFNSYFNGTYPILEDKVIREGGHQEMKDWENMVSKVFG